MTIGLYGDYKMNSNVNDPASTATPKATLGNNSILGAFVFGYGEANIFDVGFIGFYQTQANGFITLAPAVSVKDKNGMGVSLFASYFIAEHINLIGRYDYYDPNSDSGSKGDSRNYLIGGADFKVDKNFSVIPNIQLETYEKIGNRDIDASITARITLFYTFL
jgi:predicted porin